MSNAWGQLTWGEGLWGQQGNQIVSLSGLSLTLSLGGFTQTTVGEATGIALTTSMGTAVGFTDFVAQPSGLSTTLGFGSITFINDSIESPSGVALASAMGSVTTFANVEMAITGFDLTASLGSINLINWEEVNVGTSVVWTEVDRAA
jgi:hypothetical protein